MSLKGRVTRVVVKVPATTANLGPGFDVHGLALNVMYDVVEAERAEAGLTIEIEGKYAKDIPKDPEMNTAGKVVLELQRMLRGKIKAGVKLRMFKGVPPASGLGSSGASAAGAALAMNELFNLGLGKGELVRVAALGEVVAAGAIHADNVAPAIYGGFTAVLSYDPIRVLSLPPPRNVDFALAIPSIPKGSTEEARRILPKKVELPKVVRNIGGASALVAGILTSNPELMGLGMLMDGIAEPARARLFPGFSEAKEAALKAGASGAALSGAGPTVIAIVDPKRADAAGVAKAMEEAFRERGIASKSYVAKASEGAKVVEIERDGGI